MPRNAVANPTIVRGNIDFAFSIVISDTHSPAGAVVKSRSEPQLATVAMIALQAALLRIDKTGELIDRLPFYVRDLGIISRVTNYK